MPQNKQKRDVQIYGDLRGQPGYRTRPNRSGLDPVNSPAEEAFMEGTFIRNVFTLKARTHNPFYLILMFVFGVIPFPILVLAISNVPADEFGNIVFQVLFLLLFGFITLLTGAITVNFLLSILELTKIICPPRPKNTTSDQDFAKEEITQTTKRL